jgi:hypothetical protein
VRTKSDIKTKMPVNKEANGVLTPDTDFMAVREKEPVEGYAPTKEPMRFENPMAIISWLSFGL